MKSWLLSVLLVAALAAGCAGPAPQAGAPAGSAPAAAAAQPGKVTDLSPAAVQKRLDSGEKLLVLDVREDWEFRDGHIPGARLIPLGTLESRLKELDPQAPVVVVCRSGNRSAQGAAILARNGFQAVYNMTGGMNQWQGQVEK